QSSELLDLPGKRFLVEPLRVALDAFGERRGDVDLHEVVDRTACGVARVPERRDRRDDDHDPVARKQVSDERNPTDVRVAVLARKTEALRKVRPDGVSIEYL